MLDLSKSDWSWPVIDTRDNSMVRGQAERDVRAAIERLREVYGRTTADRIVRAIMEESNV